MTVSRKLRWVGIILFLVGVQAALLARLSLPSEASLYWTFATDPASLILLVSIVLAGGVFGLHLVSRWYEKSQNQLKTEMVDKQEAERRRFIQRLDHELKNPLTAIQIQLDNLQDASEANSTLEDVRDQANRLVDLTRGLRRLADLETRPLELETFELGELLQEVVELLQSPDRILLEIQKVPWSIPPIEADRELLLLAVRNVVANALNYSTGQVQIRARHMTGSLVIEVLDTGRGIPDEDLTHVTEELYRGANVHDLPGSGLGLSIVERIIERHDGTLDIMSRPGQGTIVSLMIPFNDD